MRKHCHPKDDIVTVDTTTWNTCECVLAKSLRHAGLECHTYMTTRAGCTEAPAVYVLACARTAPSVAPMLLWHLHTLYAGLSVLACIALCCSPLTSMCHTCTAPWPCTNIIKRAARQQYAVGPLDPRYMQLVLQGTQVTRSPRACWTPASVCGKLRAALRVETLNALCGDAGLPYDGRLVIQRTARKRTCTYHGAVAASQASLIAHHSLLITHYTSLITHHSAAAGSRW